MSGRKEVLEALIKWLHETETMCVDQARRAQTELDQIYAAEDAESARRWAERKTPAVHP